MAWVKGQSGNPKGRPRGKREAFVQRFWHDLDAAWRANGVDALDRMIKSHPNQFIDIVARVLPKEEQRQEIQHQIEVVLKQPDWLISCDTQSPAIESQAIDITQQSNANGKAKVTER